jgi:3-(3-hydroxy-phenyl)propionate hydroxylase
MPPPVVTTRLGVAVGLGPVGAVAAQLLAREGLRILAVEPSREPYDKPRAIGIDHEALRVLQKLGIAEEFSAGLGPYRASDPALELFED